jgi:hypothetical protein
MTQRSRRQNPYPWTWEVPLGVAVAVLALLALGVQLGRAVANGLTGTGWTFPTGAQLFDSLPGVLRGNAGAGLTGLHGDVASESTLLVCVVGTELILFALSIFLLKLGLDRWGPGRMRGMATVGEAERLLGVSRLRRVRRIVRPDLYGKGQPPA